MDNTTLYIVIADDDQEDHLLIKDAIRNCNQNTLVTSVFNGQQLLDLLNKKGYYKHNYTRNPDLTILDLRMPIMDGMEALERIKKEQRFADIPIYMLSEFDETENVNRAKSIGAENFLKKPLEYTELTNLVQGICKGITARQGRFDILAIVTLFLNPFF